MKNKIVSVDFAGTLIRSEIIEEANELRANLLRKALPTKEQHANPEELYKINREFVEKLTGLKSDVIIKYRGNNLEFMELTGGDIQNQISTTLFQIGMYITTNKYKEKIFPNGFIEQLIRIKKLGYKLAIVSGVRTDIISGMLKIVNSPISFDYIYGQPPKLGLENQECDVKELKTFGCIEYNIGDKLDDLKRILDCKKIFVKWGHPAGGEEDYADYSISKPKELEKIIK